MPSKSFFPTDRERLAAQEAPSDLASRPSRSQRKRDIESLRRLGAELVELSPGRLAKLTMPDELRRAVDEARRLVAHGAKRRQIAYIGRIMEDCDDGTLRASLAAIDSTPAANPRR